MSRRYLRRNYIGAVTKECSTRTKGHFSVGENLPKYSVNSTSLLVCEIPSRIPRRRGAFGHELYFGMKELREATWMNPMPGFVLNHDQVCASNGAEKSCRPRRRKRGLRKGKRRSRGRHPRRSADLAASVPKPPSMRKVNHRRRPERWLILASERLRVDAKKFVNLSGKSYYGKKRKRCQKLHCLAKWSRLQRRATELGFPPKMAFDTSFFRWLNREFPRKGWSEVDEHALLFTKQPFTYFDPPGPFSPPESTITYNGISFGKRPR